MTTFAIGFTGTRQGMNARQCDMLANLLVELIDQHGPLELHHGCAVGADTQAHFLASSMPHIKTVGHPCKPVPKGYGCDLLLPTRAPLVRNHDIVDATQLLIAAPSGARELLRSGTWATVRYARTLGRCRYMLLPDQRHPFIVGA